MLLQLDAKKCCGAEAPRLVAESLSKLQKFRRFDCHCVAAGIKPLKITDVRGYNFGLCCPGRGGGSAVLGCPKGGGGSFSISSVGEVRIFSGTTHCQSFTQFVKL